MSAIYGISAPPGMRQLLGGLLRTKIKRSTSQSEDHSDKEFYEIAALVGCSACFHFGTEQGEGELKNILSNKKDAK